MFDLSGLELNVLEIDLSGMKFSMLDLSGLEFNVLEFSGLDAADSSSGDSLQRT